MPGDRGAVELLSENKRFKIWVQLQNLFLPTAGRSPHYQQYCKSVGFQRLLEWGKKIKWQENHLFESFWNVTALRLSRKAVHSLSEGTACGGLTFSGLSRNILIGLRFSVWLIHWRPLSCPCLKVDWHTGLRTWTSVKYRLIQQLCCLFRFIHLLFSASTEVLPQIPPFKRKLLM